MNKLYMLVGVAGSGKSTWISNQNFDQSTIILSTDNYIEEVAKSNNKTYNDMFKLHIKQATNNMRVKLHEATAINSDIVWDQTNLTVSTRKNKLCNIPALYKKIAVVFNIPDRKLLDSRLASREGKTINSDIINSMIASFEMPTVNEGFDEIIII